MSMIRLTFQVTPFDTEPTSPQFAGVQGSHQAVEVLFKLDDRLYDPSYRYRMEFLDGTGAADTSDFAYSVYTDRFQPENPFHFVAGWLDSSRRRR